MGLPVTFMKIYFLLLVCRWYNFRYFLIEIKDDYSKPGKNDLFGLNG